MYGFSLLLRHRLRSTVRIVASINAMAIGRSKKLITFQLKSRLKGTRTTSAASRAVRYPKNGNRKIFARINVR